MKKMPILIVLLVLVVWVLPISAITWGDPDTDHENVGAIMLQSSLGWSVVCSGTLIHEKVVLTAGHCTERIQSFLSNGWITMDDVGVTFEQDATSVSTPLEVEGIITHPDYNMNPRSNPYDVGVLILKEPVTDIDPAILPYENLLEQLKPFLREGKEGVKFTVVGYGGTLSWPPPEITLEGQRQYAESEYLKLLKSWILLSQNNAIGNGGTCYGDSGGPAFLEVPGLGEILVGVTSWGDTPCVATGFYYRTDILETISFIENNVLGPIPHSGNYALWGGRGDLIFNTATMASPITLPAGATLSFWTWHDIEDYWDFGYVQISTDGGFTWTSLENPNTTYAHAPDAHPHVIANLPGFTGSSSGWVQETFDLSAYAGFEVLIRFRYITDWVVSFPGFYVDDIEVTPVGFFDDLESGSGYWTLDGWVLTTGGAVN